MLYNIFVYRKKIREEERGGEEKKHIDEFYEEKKGNRNEGKESNKEKETRKIETSM